MLYDKLQYGVVSVRHNPVCIRSLLVDNRLCMRIVLVDSRLYMRGALVDSRL